ncbi:hypothetical protein F66182_5133 [Fusarium sp. NRRL 66182]|nr:hypothetical protein F66182_5133 [Fusarium sp. NRRL 66182]
MKSLVQCVSLAAGLSQAVANPMTERADKVAKNFVVFGDSYSAVGFWPAGELPSATNPIGNPGLPGQTTSAGLNWVGYATTTLNTSLVLTYDFASSGATTDKGIIDSWAQYSFEEQVALYKQYIAPKISKADTLVAIWVGINDVGEPFWRKTEAPIAQILDRYFELVQDLIDYGLTKFVLLDVPNFSDQFPAMKDQPEADLDRLRTYIAAYNKDIKSRAATFASSHPSIKLQVFNTNPSFEKVIKDYGAYGARDATCYGSSNCLWADSYHASGPIHKVVAQNFVKAVQNIFTF